MVKSETQAATERELQKALRRVMSWALSVAYMKPALNAAQRRRYKADIQFAQSIIVKARN